jgi:hypothetical protein
LYRLNVDRTEHGGRPLVGRLIELLDIRNSSPMLFYALATLGVPEATAEWASKLAIHARMMQACVATGYELVNEPAACVRLDSGPEVFELLDTHGDFFRTMVEWFRSRSNSDCTGPLD